MGTVPIINTFPLAEAAVRRIAALLGIAIRNLEAEGAASADADLSEVDAFFGELPEGGIGRAPRLRWIARAGAGVDDVDLRALADRGVTLTNSSGLHAASMGEHCIGALLFAFQHHAARLDAQRRHEWDAAGGFAAPLRGRTIGVIGYRSIGREIARLARALGMRVLAVKLRPEDRRDEGFRPDGIGDPDGVIPERIMGLDGLAGVLRESDAIVLSLPLTDRTRGLVGADALALMKPTAWIVNVGRGPMIDETALVDALNSGHLGGAYLDVFDEEPLPADHPYWDTPNLYVSPHTAGVNSYERYWLDMGVLLEENTRRFIEGRPLVNAIDTGRAY